MFNLENIYKSSYNYYDNKLNEIHNVHNSYNLNSIGVKYRLYELFISFFSLFFFNTILIKLGDKNKKRRWYFIHAVVNTFITFMTFNDVIIVISDPLKSASGDHISLPMMLVISLHLFHIVISYKTLTLIDWMHHIVSVLIVGSIGEFYVKGPLTNYYLFFLCGLPGGLDYYLLTLNKYNLIDRMVEKKINVKLNMWIRLPGILFGCFISYICLLYNNTSNYDIYLSSVLIFLNMYNSIYFATLVVKNYGLHLEKVTKINTENEIKKSLSEIELSKLENKNK